MRGILAGALALVTLHTVVTYRGATGRIAGAFEGVASLVDRFLDPGLAAIPERKSSSTVGAGVQAATARPSLTYPARTFPG